MEADALTIEQEVLRWPGLTATPGRFGATAFRYAKREFGHLHRRDRVAGLSVMPEMREELLARDRATLHQPHMVPTSLRYNAELDTIDVGGHDLGKSKKFRDVARTGRSAFVADDVTPPWQARRVEVRGRAEVFEEGGEKDNSDFDAELIRLHPSRIVGWGIDTHPYRPNSNSRLTSVWGGAKQ